MYALLSKAFLFYWNKKILQDREPITQEESRLTHQFISEKSGQNNSDIFWQYHFI